MRYDYDRFLKELGARVKELRKERGFTHRSLITDYGFHLKHLTRIESGEGVSVPTLLRLAEVFDLPIQTLISDLGVIDDSNSTGN